MKLLFSFVFFLLAQSVYGSGAIFCEGVSGRSPAISLSWGVGRVEGSGRISPFNLVIGGSQYFIVDSFAGGIANKIPSQVPAAKPKIPVSAQASQGAGVPTMVEGSQVGYWVAENQIQIRLADQQLMQTILLLEVNRAPKSSRFSGLLHVNLAGTSSESQRVSCTKE